MRKRIQHDKRGKAGRLAFFLLLAMAAAASPAVANIFNQKMTEHGIWPYHDRACR